MTSGSVSSRGRAQDALSGRPKVAIVTGASSGIGLEMVKRLIEKGYRAVANSRNITSAMTLSSTADLKLVDGDIAIEETAKHVVRTAIQNFGTVDLLVNNAGVFKPLIYASMGTLVNGLKNVYRTILEAVSKFPDMQVVLSVGRNVDRNDLGPIPTNTIVVPVAPQIELLKRATLCITHAGLNTTLEALAQGVPLVAIPIGYDQPGVASRIAYHGVGEFVELGDLTKQRLSKLIAKVTSNPSYRDKAHWFQNLLREKRGLDVATDIIEQVFGVANESLDLQKNVRAAG